MSIAQSEYAQVAKRVKQWPTDLRQSLVDDIVKSLEGDLPASNGEWDESKNARRCELIDKEIEGTLTSAEQVELELLQKQAVAYRDRVAPLPIEGAKKLHQQLLERRRNGNR